jgi:hypothetical protein
MQIAVMDGAGAGGRRVRGGGRGGRAAGQLDGHRAALDAHAGLDGAPAGEGLRHAVAALPETGALQDAAGQRHAAARVEGQHGPGVRRRLLPDTTLILPPGGAAGERFGEHADPGSTCEREAERAPGRGHRHDPDCREGELLALVAERVLEPVSDRGDAFQ